MKTSTIKSNMLIVVLIILAVALIEGVLLLRLGRQRVDYKNYWQTISQGPVPENALVYVALGDSAAIGIGASKPQNGYVGILGNRLNEKTGRPVHIINLGVTGAKVADVISDQLPQLQGLNLPADAVVTLEIGSNNIGQFDTDKFSREFEDLIKAMPKQSVVADVPYFGGGRANAKENNALEASRIIEELTEKYQLKLVHLHDATRAKDSWRNYAADFFHPNDRAYRIWADAFWGTIEHQL